LKVRENFIFDTFIHSKNRSGRPMTKFRSFVDSTGKEVLDLLTKFYDLKQFKPCHECQTRMIHERVECCDL